MEDPMELFDPKKIPTDIPLSKHGKEIARIVSYLEANKFFGSIQINFGAEAKTMQIRQDTRL